MCAAGSCSGIDAQSIKSLARHSVFSVFGSHVCTNVAHRTQRAIAWRSYTNGTPNSRLAWGCDFGGQGPNCTLCNSNSLSDGHGATALGQRASTPYHSDH